MLIASFSIIGTYIISTISRDQVEDTHNEKTINEIRVVINPLYQKSIEFIQNGDKKMFKDLDSNLDYTITDTVGNVYYTTNSQKSIGDKVDLLEVLYYDKSYANRANGGFKIAFPLINENDHLGNLVVHFDENDVHPLDPPVNFYRIWQLFFTTIIVNIIVIMIFFFYHKKHVVKPAEELNESLANVIKGIYKKEKIGKADDFQSIFSTYNIMIEELTYLLKKQQNYVGMRKQFITVISHELKTPLSAISAYVEGLKMNVAKDEATRQKYVNVIEEKVIHLTRHIEDLFKYAQQDGNTFKIQLRERHAFDSFAKIFNSFEKQFENTKAECEIENLLPNCLVNIDEVRIEQVLQNMVNNALKHVKEEGQIKISAYRQSDEIIIVIADSGEGISPQDLPYIFDYFYQGQTSQRMDYQGIGIGLAICKDIIEKHYGQIKVKSSERQGTVFYISLPVV